MRLLVLLTALTLANAATIPQPINEKKLTEIKDVKDEPLDNVSSEQDVIDPSNLVKDVENNVRKAIPALPTIPVQVVSQPQSVNVKSDVKKNQLNEVGIDSDDTSSIKRLDVDLKNPGPPQRIEHDTQNPEHFDEGQTRLDNVDVKQAITETENTFNDNAQVIQQTIQNWLASNQQMAAIQKNLITMKQSMEAQISHMNETIHKYWAPTAANIQAVAEGTKMNIQAGLKTLQTNVQSGMKVLTEEIKAIGSGKPEGSVKAEGEKPPENNQWMGVWNNFMQSMQSQLQSMTDLFNQPNQQNNENNEDNSQNNILTSIQQGWQQNFGSLFSQNPPGTQSDENGGYQKPPTNPILQGIQNIQSFFQGPSPPASVENDPVQPNSPVKPNRPIVQAIQNNPIVQGVQNIMRPTPAPAPVAAVPSQPETPAASDAGSNVVPENPAEPEKPKVKPEEQTVLLSQSGPIQQMIEKNPIMQGLAGAVQRIQHNIRPTSPRDAETQKGHLHKPGVSSNSDSANVNSSGVAVKSDNKQKPVPETQKEPELEKKPAKPEEKPAQEAMKEVPKKTK